MMIHSYRKYILAAGLMAVSGAALAQPHSAYYTDDYKFRHEMNPAFGNDHGYVSVPVLGNININTHGNFGYQDVVMNNPMYEMGSDKKMTTFMNPYISADDALKGFCKGNNRITGDVNLTIFSTGFKAFGGYNTVSISSKTMFGMSLPYGLFEFAKNVGNNTYDIGDVKAHAQSYAEVAFGHSRDINEKLRVGAKVKVLLGVARGDVELKDVKADLADDNQWTVSGRGQADVSMKGFKYKMEEKEYKSRPGKYEYVNSADVDGAGLGGFGLAFDLGGIYKINDDWTVNASLLDLGFISWTNDVQAVNRTDRFEFGGFHDLSVSSDHGQTFDDKADSYSDQIADFANLKDNGDQGGRSTGLGATINVGATYNLPVYRRMTFGFLSSTRINGAYSWTEGRVSANWTPLKWLDGGVSFAVNSFTTSMGWVLNIHPKGYNLFIGMDHLLGKTSKEFIPLSSNASISLGMNICW